MGTTNGGNGHLCPREGFDVVVVAADAAGCVVAGRLSEDPSLRVLLLTDDGSSSIAAPGYLRGGRDDYDEWAALTGDESWSYEHVLPLFRRMEDNARGADRWHGVGGPLRVEDLSSPHPWTRAAVQSAVAAGYRRNDDFNGACQDGVGTFQVTARRGRPWSAAEAYLGPAADRPNLTVRSGALPTRVRVSGGRATGVEYRCDGEVRTAFVTSELVLCGGAVRTPQLLMLSGIGPADHLREVGVDVVHELPGVGGGLQDRPAVPVLWRARMRRSPLRAGSPRAQWFGAGRGRRTRGVEGGLFTRSRPDLPAPDLLVQFLPARSGRRSEVDLFTALVVLAHVHSRGSVRLRSADPARPPSVDPGFLTDERDLDALVCGVEKAREIAAGGPLAAVLADERFPGGSVRGADGLRRSVRATLQPLSTPASSCRMGTDERAVVDPQLRVHGMEGLRVADASVLPTLLRGTTETSTSMIGERLADLILGRTVDPDLAAG